MPASRGLALGSRGATAVNTTSPASTSDRAVLVAGACGFLGARLVGALRASGAAAQALVRPGSGPRAAAIAGDPTIVEADLRDREQTRRAIQRLRPAQIVNVARGAPRPDADGDDVGIAANLVAAAHEAGCIRIVQLGSGLEYGPVSPISERTPCHPATEFGAAKAEATRLVLSAAAPAAVVLRPFMVYGPGQPARCLIPAATRAFLGGVELPITQPGLRRDWVYVDDVVAAIMACLDGAGDGEVVNLASGRDRSNEEVVELVAAALGRRLRTRPGALEARPWDVREQRVSTEKAARVLGWRAEVPFDRGVSRAVAAIADPRPERERVA